MTEDLQTLLHERADGVGLPAPDLATITTAGRRRVRRRRGAGLIGGVAALAVVAGGYAVVTDGSSSSGRHDLAADGSTPPPALTWVVGSTLHVGEQTTDLGHPVSALVETSVGYIFSDPDGTVWSAHDGQVDRVGVTSAKATQLVGDADGSLAGWVDPSSGRPVFTVLDQSSGKTQTFPAADGAVIGTSDTHDAAVFEAIDGHTLYWRDANGQSATELTDSGDSGGSSQASRQPVIAAGHGVQVLSDSDGDQVSIRRADGKVVALDDVYSTDAQLSPDAAYVNVDADSPAVYATATGAQVTLDVQGFFADGYQWLDDHTLAVMALPTKTSDYELLTCTVPDGACTVVVPHLGNAYSEKDPDPGFQLPIGFPLGQD